MPTPRSTMAKLVAQVPEPAQSARVRVTVLLQPGVAMAFREVAHDALVSLEARDDGSAVAVVRATLDDRGRALELVPWLMGWGDAIEVLEPTSVRADVAERLKRAAGRYGR